MKRRHLSLLFILFTMACAKDKYVFIPEESDYHANVYVNGIAVRKWINAGVNPVNGFGMSLRSYNPENGLYYIIGISHVPSHAGMFNLHTLFSDSVSGKSNYSEVCCDSEPDQANHTYYIHEPDSLNNYLQLHLDTLTQEAWGKFKATYTVSTTEVLHVQCDTFYCKYTKY